MSQLTISPAVAAGFPGSVTDSRAADGGRLRGIASGLFFLGARVPFYAGAALLAAVVCVVGVGLFAMQALLVSLGGRHG